MSRGDATAARYAGAPHAVAGVPSAGRRRSAEQCLPRSGRCDRAGGCALARGVDRARLATVTSTGFAGGACSLLASASRFAGPSADASGRPPRFARGCDRRIVAGRRQHGASVAISPPEAAP
jgi:hypothetical protein